MCGVAHEVAAIYDKAVNFKEFTLTETNEAAADALSVSIGTDKAPY
ncbi:phenylalanyl-tRNA synthetase beta chain domain protein [Streptococcus pneumoniae 2070335]|nr:phenylalanyl-tRNA synthetase beta chain domain protein [Streptococcus pneumoniae 2070335]